MSAQKTYVDRTNGTGSMDPVLLAVLANRMDAIVREMSNTLLRSGRSAVLTVARDFSCALVTGDNEVLATAEGLPGHVFGSGLQTRAMSELHPNLAEGDAFLHNDPYLGNTHHADHTVLVPVFVGEEHLFTACAKAHQADCGNSEPTTYMPFAKDVYEEGAVSFPCVQVQSGYESVEDVIRMARRRIRVPEQWYGDFLATLGAARVAERRLKELAQKYGAETLKAFVKEWLDYSERRMEHAISKLPSGQVVGTGAYDPLPPVPDGIPIKVIVDVDADAGRVRVDLRDNIDCVPAGLNLCKATSTAYAITGIFNVLDEDVPHNAGSFRRIEVLLRENCVVGIPVHPTSCSMATDNLADRLVNTIQAAFAGIGEGLGLAEGGLGVGPSAGVVSGVDYRRGGQPFINQMILVSNGGPGTPWCDGWINYELPVCAGLVYRDSVEIDEQKFPIRIEEIRLMMDSGGPGKFRGAPGSKVAYRPTRDPMTVLYPLDGAVNPPKGVRGGLSGHAPRAIKIDADSVAQTLPNFHQEEVHPDEIMLGLAAGGAGYGDPLERDPRRVLYDVSEGWVSLEQAREVFGVVLTGSAEDESLAVDERTTADLRAQLDQAPEEGAQGK